MLDYPLLSQLQMSICVVVDCCESHLYHQHSTTNGGPVSIVIANECCNTSPLVGLDSATHSVVLSSTDREDQ